MPVNVKVEMVRTITGLKGMEMVRLAYGVQYDHCARELGRKSDQPSRGKS